MATLEILANPESASEWCNHHRSRKNSIGFVPTMGALHKGHLSLLHQSVNENDVTCASIFVNPLQFNDPKDFDRYPRDYDSDFEKLQQAGCNMVFLGTIADYFDGEDDFGKIPLRNPGIYARGLEGEFRPGHLEGVCTIVHQLFRFVGNCRAYFGMKDYQQLLVICDLACQMGYPTIVPCPTIRDSDGLALSSRNALLGTRERAVAVKIYRSLVAAKNAWQSGERNPETLRSTMVQHLQAPEIRIDYADLRNPSNWMPDSPTKKMESAVALIAAHLGSTRLIDNLRLDSID